MTLRRTVSSLRKELKPSFKVAGLRGLISAIKGKIATTPVLLEITRPGIQFPIYLRTPSSDIPTYQQIFIRRDYEFTVNRPPKTIVDAGANIGLAAVYFSNQFPEARIIAVEPEASNLEVLRKNIAPYKKITPVAGALWHENVKIDLVDPQLGNWAFMTQDHSDAEKSHGKFVHSVQGMTVEALMEAHGLDHIDILKIDIEGAEREVFGDASAWIEKVDTVIIELHDRMKPGCSRSFYNGTNGFDAEWRQGENLYLTRNKGCVRNKLNKQVSASL